jgi:hypothetical protein
LGDDGDWLESSQEENEIVRKAKQSAGVRIKIWVYLLVKKVLVLLLIND